MRIKLRKIISILTIIIILTSLVACNSKSNEANNSANVEEGKDFSYPMQSNKKLTYWVPLNTNVSQQSTNLAETPFGKALKERVGVDIEYLHPAAGQEKEQFNLLVASGDYPDMVEYDIKFYVGGPEKAIEDKFIIDLSDYIPKCAPNLMKLYGQYTDIEKMVKTDSGKYYSFPFLRTNDETMVYFGPIVRKDWLDDLNLDVPETIDDWYKMLKAFKEKKNASAPLTYEKGMLDVGGTFMGAYGVLKNFYLDKDGKIQYGPIQPEYKSFLNEYSKWYAEGLIDPDIETVDKKQIAAKITGGDSGASLGYQASRLGVWLNSMKDDSTYDLVGTKNPVLEKGGRPMFGQKSSRVPGTAVFITSGCKDVEAACRLLDYGYSEEGHMLFNFGVEGESYKMVDSYPTYTDSILKNPDNSASSMLGQFTRSCYSGAFIQDERYIQQYGYTFDQQKVANKNWQYSDMEKHRMPKVTPTPDESEEIATIMNEIKNYVDEMYVKFLLGQESLDNYDKYIENINKMGIDKALEIYEDALVRYNNR